MTVNMVGIGSGPCPVPPMVAVAVAPSHASGEEVKRMTGAAIRIVYIKMSEKSKLFPTFFISAAICCYAANSVSKADEPRLLGGCVAMA